ncbi:MAG TPA: hypothetical protein VE224_03785 [Pseudolabrys sp.]|jgi:uncharacterized protein|nr:hypothetical protein [Pseudolabrys sp.]
MKAVRATVAALILSLAAAGAGHATGYAPLDCAKAHSPTEHAICYSYALGQQEARMATLFEWTMSLVAMGARGDIGDAQRAFIRKPAACGANVACIRRVYDARIAQLKAVMKRIASNGPF